MKALFDTNVLVYSYNTSSPFYSKARKLFEEIDDIYITQQILIEFYSIITNKKRIEFPVSHEEGFKVIKTFNNPKVLTVLSPNTQTLDILLTKMEKLQLKNVEIFDAYIVATMISNNIYTIYTSDEKVFSKFPDVKIVNPFI